MIPFKRYVRYIPAFRQTFTWVTVAKIPPLIPEAPFHVGIFPMVLLRKAGTSESPAAGKQNHKCIKVTCSRIMHAYLLHTQGSAQEYGQPMRDVSHCLGAYPDWCTSWTELGSFSKAQNETVYIHLHISHALLHEDAGRPNLCGLHCPLPLAHLNNFCG